MKLRGKGGAASRHSMPNRAGLHDAQRPAMPDGSSGRHLFPGQALCRPESGGGFPQFHGSAHQRRHGFHGSKSNFQPFLRRSRDEQGLQKILLGYHSRALPAQRLRLYPFHWHRQIRKPQRQHCRFAVMCFNSW